MEDLTIQQEWVRMDTRRSAMKSRLEDYALWTLPYLFLPERTTEQDELSVAAGSIGARSVNHLANKLVSALFVPYRPFFRLIMTDEAKARARAVDQNLTDAQIDLILSRTEMRAMESMNVAVHRTQAVLAVKNLIVTGNALLYYPQEKNVEVYNIKDYVMQRDLNGFPIKIITRDVKAFSALPDDIQKKLRDRKKYSENAKVSIYTKLLYNPANDKYDVSQAADAVSLDVRGSYPVGKLPWIPLTWNLVRGEDYGRGLVEDYAYAFHTHQVLTSAQMRLYAVIADVKLLVDPASAIDPDELNRSASGTYFPGREGDITCPRIGVEVNIAGINDKITSLERELAQAFLLTSAVTRDAERVTAEEIRMQIQELETAHGGIYSRLAAEWQTPLIGIILDRIGFDMGKDFVPQIVTGMEAMSRNGDLENMQLFISDLAQTQMIPERFQQYLKEGEFLATLGALRNVQYEKFLKSQEEVKREQQAAQQAAMAQQQQMIDMQTSADMQKDLARNM